MTAAGIFEQSDIAASRVGRSIPGRAGVGLKPEHFADILGERPDLGFFEIHAENYMGAGGPTHRHMEMIRRDYPVSVHGVGLSIGAARGLDPDHLDRLKAVCERYEPGLVSEHLAWSSHGASYLNDLLPLPYTQETLARVCDHVDQVQTHLKRRMLLENPSTYLLFDASVIPETEFLAEVARRTGCGLLLDVNNVHVSASNHEIDARAYLKAFPIEKVGEIHLGGHAVDVDDEGHPLLIDSHDREVDDLVWDLFAEVIERAGPIPTLVEWDADLPAFPVLAREAALAETILQSSRGGRSHALAS
ncbi:hypothetical protein HDIA_4067 [Hartmannibacter diazotrophicus]|uniref:UPF0276 protein HDIA_4067 n=1 Tax=Hartmannibacter diazotrophicus TaxID=1482074 RepID=A0A2C9DBU3_9HYPH|nr:DUF692 domain-containing protein [Hartmannibacter diazotrophicus]SON57608.1 hypothetical protein HDIA_4067 [Hartmannibacter diazotrophicus]